MQRRNSAREALPPLSVAPDGSYASEENLQSSVAYLKSAVAGLGLCQDLNLMSTNAADVVQTCNVMYTLLSKHQQDNRYKDQLKHDMQRSKLEIQALDKDRLRLESKLVSKEREIGTLLNKSKAGDDAHKEELAKAYRDLEELQKKVSGYERRMVQMQHEIKRKEREYERLQERLSHYLADKKRNEKALMEVAGELTKQLNGGTGPNGRMSKSDEGIKAVVSAYESKQQELNKENKDLRAALAALQAEHKAALNANGTPRAADTGPVVQDSFFKAASAMGADELRAELATKLKLINRRMDSLSNVRPGSAHSVAEQRMLADLQITRGIIKDQEQIIFSGLSALRNAQQNTEAQHVADMKDLAQRYQAQLAIADETLQAAKKAQHNVMTEEARRLQDEMAASVGEMRAQKAAALNRVKAAEAALQQVNAEKEQLRESITAEIAAVVASTKHEMGQQSKASEDSIKKAMRMEQSEQVAKLEKLEKDNERLVQTVERLKSGAAALTAETGALREKALRERSIAHKATTGRDAFANEKLLEAKSQHDAEIAAIETKHKEALQAAAYAAAKARAELEQEMAASQQAAEAKLQNALQEADKHRADLESAFNKKMVALEQRTAQALQQADDNMATYRKDVERQQQEDATKATATIQSLEEQLETVREQAKLDLSKLSEDMEAKMLALQQEVEQQRSAARAQAASDLAVLERQMTTMRLESEKQRGELEEQSKAEITSVQALLQKVIAEAEEQQQALRAEADEQIKALQAKIVQLQKDADRRVSEALAQADQSVEQASQAAAAQVAVLEGRLQETQRKAEQKLASVTAAKENESNSKLSALEAKLAAAVAEHEAALVAERQLRADRVASVEAEYKLKLQQALKEAEIRENNIRVESEIMLLELQDKLTAAGREQHHLHQEATSAAASVKAEYEVKLQEAMKAAELRENTIRSDSEAKLVALEEKLAAASQEQQQLLEALQEATAATASVKAEYELKLQQALKEAEGRENAIRADFECQLVVLRDQLAASGQAKQQLHQEGKAAASAKAEYELKLQQALKNAESRVVAVQAEAKAMMVALEEELAAASREREELHEQARAVAVEAESQRREFELQMVRMREEAEAEKAAALAAVKGKAKVAVAASLHDMTAEKESLHQQVDYLTHELEAIKDAQAAKLETERLAVEKQVRSLVAKDSIALKQENDRLARELATFKRDFSIKVGDAMKNAEKKIQSERTAMQQEKSAAIRQVQEELATLSKDNFGMRQKIEEFERVKAKEAERYEAELQDLQTRLATIEETKDNWNKEKYQKFSVALQKAEDTKAELDVANIKLAENAEKIKQQEKLIAELSAGVSSRPGVFTPSHAADQRLSVALRRADSEKQDLLKEAAMERENALDDLKTQLQAAMAEKEELRKELDALQGSSRPLANTDKVNELQQQLDIERAASEGKDKKLREAIIQAEAARRASRHALDKQKKYEEMQQHYKELLATYAPGLGAGALLERGLTRRASDMSSVASENFE